MNPKALMVFGVLGGATAAFAHLITGEPSLLVFSFASGALFGKGYGIYEERDG